MNEFLNNLIVKQINIENVDIEIIKFKEEFYKKFIEIYNNKIKPLSLRNCFIHWEYENSNADYVTFNESNSILEKNFCKHNKKIIDCYFEICNLEFRNLNELENFSISDYYCNLSDPLGNIIKPNENILFYEIDEWNYTNKWLKIKDVYYFWIDDYYQLYEELPPIIKISDIETSLFLLRK